ncbi:TonB-copper family protein [Gaetbulibacter saemankumensis]|uniref:TonB-dependent receptor n=1 Tax=Gaetbulibacter saemankumensis TaxID=311208 RepID=UPI00048997D4|nr:TonB-dependent receptor [Gaetbulibacter saemankumensis]
MKRLIFSFFSVIVSWYNFAQNNNFATQKDTTHLDEIQIIGRHKLSHYRQEKTLSSIDDYLEKANKITMIKRGNYAWEPTLNNMASERLNITIDGMQIFGACTDKMDPITSYVDVSNLDNVNIGSGQSGNENGHCIGGSIDLKLPDSKFYESGLKTSVDLGYETNGNYKISGLDLEYSGKSFYFNLDGIFRKSDNYKSGNNQEVLYSQFQKYNLSLQTGIKVSENHSIDANIIYDKANDVGYPALPMDVSLAEAVITSLSHNYSNNSNFIKTLESKLYFNSITHIMDDSKRPDVPIRMDMPGWSNTFGFYSKAQVSTNKHHSSFNLNGYYNQSLAEMTMYPNNSNEPDMFMHTWPDIRTLNTGFFVKDIYQINSNAAITNSARLSYQNNRIAKEEGLESLKIFYPDIEANKSRILTSIVSVYNFKKEQYSYSFGLGYGSRAPSVSEGYAFYIFNSYDNFDYIGNPNLKNEKALEVNFSSSMHKNNFHIGIEASYFRISDYIIGDIDPTISPMTIGANGVKLHKSLDYATIFDIYLNSSYQLSSKFSVNGTIGYNYGKASNRKYLPFIKPLSYLAEINYSTQKFNAAIQLTGNGNQSQYSSFYGENKTPAYALLNCNLGNAFDYNNNKIVLKYGIENLLDTKYSTFADWNGILRQGRNFYINLSFILK